MVSLSLEKAHPVLLTMPSFDGTLAAVRCLGERGIPVTVAGGSPLAPARWSKHVMRWLSSPSVFEPERYLDWLLEFGRREPGHVLYPTSDDLAWLFARHSAELSEYFRLYQPPANSVLQLLDKKALSELCLSLQVPTPTTVYPASEREALELADSVGFPLLLKPRTQMFLATRNKGEIIDSREDLRFRYADYVRSNAPHPTLRELLPNIEQPMLQKFVPDAARDTYSISGFVAPDGAIVARAAVKVLQRPRRVGVGVCFEEAAVDLEALAGLARLCQRVGYFGIFEAEFVRGPAGLELIDFNPRFYGQMGFESARGLPLPYLAWLGAVGEHARLREEIERAQRWESGRGYVYCNRFFFNLTLFWQGVSGSMSPEERQQWRTWLSVPRDRALAFDPMESDSDPMPALVSKLREIYYAARHPRAFYRKVIVGGVVWAMNQSAALGSLSL